MRFPEGSSPYLILTLTISYFNPGARVPAFRLELISQACCSGDSYMELDTGAESQSQQTKVGSRMVAVKQD